MLTSKQERAELLQELTTAAAMPVHANVVHYIRGWQERRKLHIQMELCAAGNLDTLLKRNDLAPADAALPEDLLWLVLRCAALPESPLEVRPVALCPRPGSASFVLLSTLRDADCGR